MTASALWLKYGKRQRVAAVRILVEAVVNRINGLVLLGLCRSGERADNGPKGDCPETRRFMLSPVEATLQGCLGSQRSRRP